MTRLVLPSLAVVAALLGGACRLPPAAAPEGLATRQIAVVTTTSIVADLVARVGGERVQVHAMMGPGVDPHLYKASEGDITRMASADLVVYNGLHLEGKMTEVFEQMARRGIKTVAVASAIDRAALLGSLTYPGNYDPHVWFDVSLWRSTIPVVERGLGELDPTHADGYRTRAAAYATELDELDRFVREQSARLPDGRRVLVTAHDAFNYFRRAYGFDVFGLQGLSTATEAGTADVRRLADVIATRRIPAIFVESSVPPQGIEAVQAAVRARGFSVAIGGSLFSDSLGNPGSPEGTYAGTVRHNITTIVEALLRDAPGTNNE
jgi:manganese/zinc/iron transport system substrate-binding protein